jgi:hypothetical protein
MPADPKPLKSRVKKGPVVLVAAFFAIQVIVDLFQSVTAYPFEHYGMFSESYAAPDSLSTFEIIADGQRLETEKFGIYRWDMIQQPLAAFDRQSRTNDNAFDRSRISAAFPAIYSRLSANLENAPTAAAAFPDWYLNYLSRLLHHPIHSLRVNRCQYRFLKNQPILNQPILNQTILNQTSPTLPLLTQKIPWISR